MYLTVMTHQAAINLDLISVVTFSSYASDMQTSFVWVERRGYWGLRSVLLCANIKDETGDLRKTAVVEVGLGLVVVG